MSNVSGGGDGLIPNSSLYSDVNNMKPSGLIRLLSICCVLAPFTLYSKDLSKPNIVVILADDLGYSDVGSFGGEIETPHLDALAEGGVRCSQMYNAGRCCPSRSTRSVRTASPVD